MLRITKAVQTGGGKEYFMSLLIPEDLPDCIDKPVEKALTPVAENIGKTFSDIWFLAMGGISQYAEKKRVKYAVELEKLKKSLEEKIEAIPPENRVEPNTQNVCQALEDAKYCTENEEIREMFANLIASTMNSQTSSSVHPSFSVILKQMTSSDANFFRLFSRDSKIAICSYRIKYKSGGYSSLLEKVYLKNENSSLDEANSNALILSVLERLGLIRLSLSESLIKEGIYQVYENSVILQDFKRLYNSNEESVEIKTGTAQLTAIGHSLLEICCPVKRIYITIPTQNPPDHLNS